jgi:hypothetical protein
MESAAEEVAVEELVEIPEGGVMIEVAGAEGIVTGKEGAELPAGGDGWSGGFFFSEEESGRMG